MRQPMSHTIRFPDVVVMPDIDLSVEMDKRELEENVCEYAFSMTWDARQAEDADAQVALLWSIPFAVHVASQHQAKTRTGCRLEAEFQLDADMLCSAGAVVQFRGLEFLYVCYR